MTIRAAFEEDTPRILELIRDLAHYEKSLSEVRASEENLRDSLFCEQPKVFCDVVLSPEGLIVGIAIWYLNYSTWLGKHGMYLEDLYVDAEYRGKGYGMALLKYLANTCVERGYERFQWWVLDWNSPAIDLYESLGAVGMDEWTVFRLSGESLKKFGESK